MNPYFTMIDIFSDSASTWFLHNWGRGAIIFAALKDFNPLSFHKSLQNFHPSITRTTNLPACQFPLERPSSYKRVLSRTPHGRTQALLRGPLSLENVKIIQKIYSNLGQVCTKIEIKQRNRERHLNIAFLFGTQEYSGSSKAFKICFH